MIFQIVTSVLSFILLMTLCPDVQKRAQDKIYRVVDRDQINSFILVLSSGKCYGLPRSLLWKKTHTWDSTGPIIIPESARFIIPGLSRTTETLSIVHTTLIHVVPCPRIIAKHRWILGNSDSDSGSERAQVLQRGVPHALAKSLPYTPRCPLC